MLSYRRDIKGIFILAGVSFLISLFIFFSEVLRVFEYKVYDIFSRHLNPLRVSEKICIIQVDQQSLDALSKQGITWPWPRQIYAPVIEYLSEAEAVFVDILFTEESSYGRDDDKIFGESIKKAGNIYLPLFLSRERKIITGDDETFLKRIAIKQEFSTPFIYHSFITPVDVLKKYAHGLGNVTIMPDEDGVYRRMPLIFRLDNHLIPGFVMSYFVEKRIIQFKKDAIYVNDTPIPARDGKILLQYHPEKNPFSVFSFVDILNAYIRETKKEQSSTPKTFFKGKTVFIGLTAAGLFDLKPTPISLTSPGTIIHATAFENMMDKHFIKSARVIYIVLLIALISAIIPYIVLRHHSLGMNLFIFFISLVTIFSFSSLLFRLSIYIQVIPLTVSLILSFIIASLYSYAIEGRERLFIKRTFSQYMDRKIVDYLLKNPSAIKPGGQSQEVTVFFADIAGFTTISERYAPEDTALMLHQVLNGLTEIVIKHSGVVDKYIGDCIMAFWGAPVKTKEDGSHACHAALECLERLNDINGTFSTKGMEGIAIRIGMHTGNAIVGNIGSDRLFNYTVIGDTVNLASRLESVNKFFKTRIIVSEETIKKTEDNFLSRELGLIEVKGKTIPVRIFELIGEKGKVSSEKNAFIKLYNQGLSFYREMKWKEAKGIFESLLKDSPDDGPSEFYKAKCEELLSGVPLTEGWSIVRMKEK